MGNPFPAFLNPHCYTATARLMSIGFERWMVRSSTEEPEHKHIISSRFRGRSPRGARENTENPTVNEMFRCALLMKRTVQQRHH